jgi:hypothetical protein
VRAVATESHHDLNHPGTLAFSPCVAAKPSGQATAIKLTIRHPRLVFPIGPARPKSATEIRQVESLDGTEQGRNQTATLPQACGRAVQIKPGPNCMKTRWLVAEERLQATSDCNNLSPQEEGEGKLLPPYDTGIPSRAMDIDEPEGRSGMDSLLGPGNLASLLYSCTTCTLSGLPITSLSQAAAISCPSGRVWG